MTVCRYYGGASTIMTQGVEFRETFHFASQTRRSLRSQAEMCHILLTMCQWGLALPVLATRPCSLNLGSRKSIAREQKASRSPGTRPFNPLLLAVRNGGSEIFCWISNQVLSTKSAVQNVGGGWIAAVLGGMMRVAYNLCVIATL